MPRRHVAGDTLPIQQDRYSSASLPLQRVHQRGVEGEDPNNYSSGVYSPVDLGNLLKGDRYWVVHKLGWGGYATVWFTRDVHTPVR